MELNPIIKEILRDFKIDVDIGTLCLLGIYHKLDIEKIYSEEVIKAINITKIVTIDYTAKPYGVQWNTSLYIGEETEFSWVKDWAKGFEKLNPDRVVELGACINRMKQFFSSFPQFRKDDVYAARDLYFKGVKDTKFIKHAHKFIKEETGKSAVSLLSAYCQKIAESKSQVGNNYQKGNIL